MYVLVLDQYELHMTGNDDSLFQYLFPDYKLNIEFLFFYLPAGHVLMI